LIHIQRNEERKVQYEQANCCAVEGEGVHTVAFSDLVLRQYFFAVFALPCSFAASRVVHFQPYERS